MLVGGSAWLTHSLAVHGVLAVLALGCADTPAVSSLVAASGTAVEMGLASGHFWRVMSGRFW